MSCSCITRGLEVGSDLLESSTDVKVLQYSLEHSKRSLRLVEWHFVAGLVDAKEADCEDVSG